jgi:basic amino acid/polyamine antiporter, APA family
MLARVTSPPAPIKLVRTLGIWQCVGLVVGTIIGTGVFLKTPAMAARAGSPLWVLIAWAGAGGLSLAGALTYAELGAMFPEAGGEYVYLREAYGRFAGYLYAWTRFWVGSPGSIAAYGVGAATFLRGALPIDHLGGVKVVAISLIAFFTIIGCLKVRTGGNLQVLLTAIKVIVIVGLAAAAFIAPPHAGWANVSSSPSSHFPGFSAFGLTILSALWAYDGWNNLPMAAGEVRDPGRNLPRSLIYGALAVLAIYALIHVAYFYALPFSEILASNDKHAASVPVKVAATFAGPLAGGLLAAAMALSALSAMHGSILTGARVPFALARDELAPKALSALSAKAVPVNAVIVQGVCASLLALSGTFEQLTNSVVFASWTFYALNAGSVMLLRKRYPDRARPYRVPFFPVIPAMFVLLSGLLLINTIFSSFRDSALGLILMVLSAPVYLLTTWWRGKAPPATASGS